MEERVTAVDVLMELEGDLNEARHRLLPKHLRSEDFDVRVAGQRQTVVGLADPRRSNSKDLEPWTIVLYFDFGLARQDSIRWAANALFGRAEELVSLGAVEIVVADPTPARRLPATRDVDRLKGALSGLALEPGGGHEVLAARSAFLEDFDQGLAQGVSTRLGERVLEEEVAFIGRRLDELLLYLVDRENAATSRALFLIGDGFDLEPADFYRSIGLALPERAPTLSERTESLARTLASYGWIVVCLAPPEPGPGLVPGRRIGKWRLTGVGAISEKARDRQRGEAYLLLGESHLAGGDAKAARRAFERALYHFAGDPRTAERQAAAHAALGRALRELGHVLEARQAFRNAVQLDPQYADDFPEAQNHFVDPQAPLELLVGRTVGRNVRDANSMADAVASLFRRLRLTYQVAGWPVGKNQEVEIKLVGSKLELRAPRWVHSGTPEAVAAARVRQVLGGSLVEGQLPLLVELEAGVLGVRLERPPLSGTHVGKGPAPLRITIGVGRPAGDVTVQHHRVELELDREPPEWIYRAAIEEFDAEEWVAVVVEDIHSGRWGAAVIE